jgi:3-deoxy-manno-octulosonate cytidylyltransferase (CMP-KDO synthetase)
MSRTLIVIPARYHSKRFPGKPLTLLAGKSMLHRVFDRAQQAAAELNRSAITQAQVVIATEDRRIVEHAQTFGAGAMLTPDSCLCGTDRALAAAQTFGHRPDYVLNFQGDSPLTPASLLVDLITHLHQNTHWQVATPVMPLSWPALSQLRTNKITTPFSGTTAIIKADGQALWFSKNIIPALRDEEKWRQQPLSPVFAHVGLYAYRYEALERFVSLPEGHYEKLEGLEQLRLLENGIPIHAIQVDPALPPMLGVDTPEDAQRVSTYLQGLSHE